MAKTMARIKDGVVVNLEWVNDFTSASDTLKDVYDIQIRIGDTYVDGKFYHDDVEIVTYRDKIRNILTYYDMTLSNIAASVPNTMTDLESDTNMLSIESRKQLILSYLRDALETLNMLGVSSTEKEV